MKVTLNVFCVTERTRPYHKIYYFQFQRAITPKIRNPELRFLCSAHCLMFLYICVKFHENISNGFRVTERTRFCYRQTDRQTDDRRPGQKQDVSLPYGGRHNYISSVSYLYSFSLPLNSMHHIFISFFYIKLKRKISLLNTMCLNFG